MTIDQRTRHRNSRGQLLTQLPQCLDAVIQPTRANESLLLVKAQRVAADPRRRCKFVNLLGSVVVVWSLARILSPSIRLGRLDGILQFLSVDRADNTPH